MRRALLLLCLCLLGCAHETRVTIAHFSDYHSHALPLFSEHRPDQGGLARALFALAEARARHRNLLVLSGGDMLNHGVPAWSDKYRCAEWSWLSGVVDAMALGNHDVDYGWEVFRGCREKARFPILSANLLDAQARPLLPGEQGRPYLVRRFGAVRVGLFALAGPDFALLVPRAHLPPGARFADSVEAARRIVRALREEERVDAVVFFGHQARESDFAMARAVPGIDLILGTHSHYKSELTTIPSTRTAFISPYQYLTYLAEVELRFQGRRLAAVTGRLRPLDRATPEDPLFARRVASMEADLEQDPTYAARFQAVGHSAAELSIEDLSALTVQLLRDATRAQAAFSTAGSFRAAIAPGPIRREDLLRALPYNNRVLTLALRGDQLLRLLALSEERRGSDLGLVHAGLSGGGGAWRIRRPGPEPGEDPVRPEGTYRVALTDFLLRVAPGYQALLREAAPAAVETEVWVSDTLLRHLQTCARVTVPCLQIPASSPRSS